MRQGLRDRAWGKNKSWPLEAEKHADWSRKQKSECRCRVKDLKQVLSIALLGAQVAIFLQNLPLSSSRA
jgi:hypothetical protein